MKKLLSALIAVALVASMSFALVAEGTVFATTNFEDGKAEDVLHEILTGGENGEGTHGVLKNGYLDIPIGNGSYIQSAIRTPSDYTWVMDVMAYDPEMDDDLNSDGDYNPLIQFSFGGDSIMQFRMGYDFKTKKFFYINSKEPKDPNAAQVEYEAKTLLEVPFEFSLNEFHTIALKVRKDATATLYFDGIDVLNAQNIEFLHSKNDKNAKVFQKMNVGLAIDNVVIASSDYDGFTLHEHEWTVNEVYKEATVKEEGFVNHTCSACGITRDEVTPKLPHDHTGGSATCDTKAICDICGEAYGELAEHTFGDMVVVKNPTGTKTGLKEATCSVCGAKKQEVIPATGIICDVHTGGTATCTHKAVCEVCGDEYGDLLPHTWDEGVVTTPATETADGVKTYTCSVCQTTKTEIIPKTGTAATDPSEKPSDNNGPDKKPIPDTSAGNGIAAVSAVAAVAVLAVVAKKKF